MRITNKKMTKKNMFEVLNRLDEKYGTEKICYLNHDNAWQLLIATILSAQCTDARVNMVTGDLFRKYSSIDAFADADVSELAEDIRSTGFYRNKAANIIACMRRIRDEFNYEIPSGIEELTSLAGVGRKTANVIRGNVYDIPSIVVDTHVKRISGKLGLTECEDSEKIEQELMKKLPMDHWIMYNMQIIALGRTICKAVNPDCENCFLNDLCPSGRKLR